MMLGLRDVFTYARCAGCGSIYLPAPPADAARYYPAHYYAFDGSPSGPVRTALRRLRARAIFGDAGAAGRLVLALATRRPDVEAVARLAPSRDARILDVGCGRGELLLRLRDAGYRQLRGADPYVAADVTYPGGVRVERRHPGELTGRFDLVMMHHAFEHAADPRATLAALAGLLAPDGVILLRVPLADSQACRTYGADWVQLDAPRHLFVPTRAAIHALSRGAGLVVERTVDDSGAFQFWGSEQYRRDIPLTDARSVLAGRRRSIFRRAELAEFASRAAALNAAGEGDQACFYLRRR